MEEHRHPAVFSDLTCGSFHELKVLISEIYALRNWGQRPRGTELVMCWPKALGPLLQPYLHLLDFQELEGEGSDALTAAFQAFQGHLFGHHAAAGVHGSDKAGRDRYVQYTG